MSAPAAHLSQSPRQSHLRLVPPPAGRTRYLGPSPVPRRIKAGLALCLLPVVALLTLYHLAVEREGRP